MTTMLAYSSPKLYVITLFVFFIRIHGEIITPKPCVTYRVTVCKEYMRFDEFVQSIGPDSDLDICGGYVYKKTIRHCHQDEQTGKLVLQKCASKCGEHTEAGRKYCTERCYDYYNCSYGFQFRNITFCDRYYDYYTNDRPQTTSTPMPPTTEKNNDVTTTQTTPTPQSTPSPSPETSTILVVEPTPTTAGEIINNQHQEENCECGLVEPNGDFKWYKFGVNYVLVRTEYFWLGTTVLIVVIIAPYLVLIGYCCRHGTWCTRRAKQPGMVVIPASNVGMSGETVYTVVGRNQSPDVPQRPIVNYNRKVDSVSIPRLENCYENHSVKTFTEGEKLMSDESES